MSSRLFAVGLAGPVLTPAERAILSASPPWGVILFRRNLETFDALARLVGDLRDLSVDHLLLDQEGGPVDRLRDLLGPAPSLQSASRAGAARRAGAAAGAALLAHWGEPHEPPHLEAARAWAIPGLKDYRERWERGLYQVAE
ncbi:MAG TPA: hypothetical protein VGG65_00910 [Thermoanaerobaculia bacterium]